MNSIYSKIYRSTPHLPVVLAYYDRADMESTTPKESWHHHSVCEFMYVYEGEAEIHIHPDTLVTLRAREYIWLDAYVAHKLVINPNSICSMMNIEFDLVPQGKAPGLNLDSLCKSNEGLRNMLSKPSSYLVLKDEQDLAYGLLKQIIRQASGNFPGHQSRSSMLAAGMLLLTASARQTQELQASPSGSEHVEHALRLIQEQFSQPLTSADVARALHLHPGYLYKLFKQHAGQSPSEAIQQARMAAGRRLLSSTQDSIADIAAAVGINSAQYFAKLFKLFYGLSPTEYRKSLI